MTRISGDIGRLSRVSAFGGWVRAVAVKFRRPARLKDTSRAEFEQIARDLDLSPPQLYELLTGRVVSAERFERRLSEIEFSSEPVKSRQTRVQQPPPAASQEFLPIGPSCC